MKWGIDFVSLVLCIAIGLLLLTTIYLLYQNHSSDLIFTKILPAVIIGLVSALLTLFFTLKERTINSSFQAAIISHSTKMTPIEEIKPNYYKYYGGKRFSARCYLNPTKDQQLLDYNFSVISTEIIQLLFTTFQGMQHDPYADFFSNNPFPRPLIGGIDKSFLSWEEWINRFKSNSDLYDCLYQINPKIYDNDLMSIPVDTKITFTFKKYLNEICFENQFLKFQLEISNWSGKRDIGEWAWILELDKSEKDSFWISHFIISTNVTFKKYRSGHPKMKYYENWIKTILDRLVLEYDSELQLKNAIEFYHNFSKNLSNGDNDKG